MKSVYFGLLVFLVALISGSGCGSGTGSPEQSGFQGESGNRDSSERIDGSKGSGSFVSGKKSTLPGRPGTLTVHITTTGSLLPPATSKIVLTFDEVSVYRAGEGWISLPLKNDPNPIELFRLPFGTSADLTESAELPQGRYSRIRVGIKEANILVRRSNYKISIPNYSLRTEEEIEFEMGKGNPIDLVAILNLRQSIQPSGGGYRLFPTFYVIEDSRAVALQGSIQMGTFGLSGGSHYQGKIWVVVYRDMDKNRRPTLNEEIARFAIRKGTDISVFKIPWLAAKENYIATVEADGRVIYSELVEAQNLPDGHAFELNKGKPI